MMKVFHSKAARVIGAAAAAASVAAVLIAVAPSHMPQALAQGPGTTVPPIGDGLQALIDALIAFIQRFLALLPFPRPA